MPAQSTQVLSGISDIISKIPKEIILEGVPPIDSFDYFPRDVEVVIAFVVQYLKELAKKKLWRIS